MPIKALEEFLPLSFHARKTQTGIFCRNDIMIGCAYVIVAAFDVPRISTEISNKFLILHTGNYYLFCLESTNSGTNSSGIFIYTISPSYGYNMNLNRSYLLRRFPLNFFVTIDYSKSLPWLQNTVFHLDNEVFLKDYFIATSQCVSDGDFYSLSRYFSPDAQYW